MYVWLVELMILSLVKMHIWRIVDMVFDDFLFQGTGVLAAVWSFHHYHAFWKDPWKWVRLLWLQGDNFAILSITDLTQNGLPRLARTRSLR